jgi:hypothetical protein
VVVLDECLECDDARTKIADELASLIDDSDWNICATDADCVSQPWGTPCDGQCNVAIASTAVTAFEAAIGGFGNAVCNPDLWRLSCGGPRDVDCPVAPLCVEGTCRIGAATCAARMLNGCTNDGLCAELRGAAYDPDATCFSADSTPFNCADPDVSCPPSLRAALDVDGNCFAFGGCLPPGFTLAPDDHPCSAVIGVTCAE